jgi:hypothetical protein
MSDVLKNLKQERDELEARIGASRRSSTWERRSPARSRLPCSTAQRAVVVQYRGRGGAALAVSMPSNRFRRQRRLVRRVFAPQS